MRLSPVPGLRPLRMCDIAMTDSKGRQPLAEAPYKVNIVVDREFGEKLTALPLGVPVWIVDTPVNRSVVQRRWIERPQNGHLTGLTLFGGGDDGSPEELLLGELETIDLHHGAYSHVPPYSVLEVFGSPLSAAVEAALSKYGFDQFELTTSSFRATRPEPMR